MGLIRKIIKSPITVTKWCVEAAVIGGATACCPPLGLGMVVGKNVRNQHKKEIEKAAKKAADEAIKKELKKLKKKH
jgi:hypothetical protein